MFSLSNKPAFSPPENHKVYGCHEQVIIVKIFQGRAFIKHRPQLLADIWLSHEEYDEETDEYIQIKDFDYDGIIIRNVRDSISPLVDKYCDEYIVWNPTQIKQGLICGVLQTSVLK